MTSYTPKLRGDEIVSIIQIDYPPASSDPARVFRAMALLIDAFQRTDQSLAAAVSAEVAPLFCTA